MSKLLAVYWRDAFDAYPDGRVLAMGLAIGDAEQCMDVETLDAMIDGAKACRHAAELASEIRRWSALLDGMLDTYD